MKKKQLKYKKTNEFNNIKKLYWSLSILFLSIVFIIFFVIGDYGLYQIYLLHQEKNEIQEHITSLKANQDSLQTEISKLESDLKYIEKLAREKYRMAKHGEKIFRVIDRTKE